MNQCQKSYEGINGISWQRQRAAKLLAVIWLQEKMTPLQHSWWEQETGGLAFDFSCHFPNLM